MYDINNGFNGGHSNNWFRNWSGYKYMMQYFPLKLIKTTDIDPSGNYIFGVHPHGLISISAFAHFGNNGSGFDALFPGLKPHLLVLEWMLYLPITREYLMSGGGSAATKESFYNILHSKAKGEVCIVVVGGAAESLERSHYRLVLKSRKGFVKMAIQTGASLVPVFSFGEIDLFNTISNPEGSYLRILQNFLKKKVKLGFPVWWGRGLRKGSFGFLPFKKNTYTVVGKPINVAKNILPSNEDIDEIHRIYVEGLTKLFNENKLEYGNESDILEII